MADRFDPNLHPHRRFNALSGVWNLVSPARTERPWRGHEEQPSSASRAHHDENCYLCPGNERAGGERNPRYEKTFAFTNDFAALEPGWPQGETAVHELLQATSVAGTCRVLCYSPRHDLTPSTLTPSEIADVISLWQAEELSLRERYAWVQIFENQGELMGTSMPHPHGQVWAMDGVPTEGLREETQQRRYYEQHGRLLLLDYVEREIELATRVIVAEEHWVVLVPWWATWPFETLVLPRRHLPTLTAMGDDERVSLARALKELLARYDNLFDTDFPYSMGWHVAPGLGANEAHWQAHAHYYPPLLRSATVRKFMVGYELLAEAQRDLTPEEAARRLQASPATRDGAREG